MLGFYTRQFMGIKKICSYVSLFLRSICCHGYVTGSSLHLSQNPRNAKRSREDQRDQNKSQTNKKAEIYQHYLLFCKLCEVCLVYMTFISIYTGYFRI
jgi:hypothetical protein